MYLLFCAENAGVIHLKIGKSNHPERRLADYFTHCPLELQSFYVAEIESEGLAYSLEVSLLNRLAYLGGRGEWRVLNCGRQVEEVFAAATDILPSQLVRMTVRSSSPAP